MAIGFGSTYGVGSTDKVQIGAIGQSTQRTIAFRCLWNSTGGGGFARILASSNLVEYVYLNGGIGTYGTLQYSRNWNSSGVQWTINAANTSNTVYSVVISYDGSSSTNDIVAYVNGSVSTIGVPGARTAPLNTDNGTYNIGNREDNVRNWDGWISSVAVWNEIIPASIAQQISNNCSPLIWQSNLIYYNPMISNAVDVAGGKTQTVTGTKAVNHQPVLREAGGGFTSVDYSAKINPNRMIFEGSSTIQGYGLTDPVSQSFPAQAGFLLGSSWNTTNYGLGGTKYSDIINTSPKTTYWQRNSLLVQDVIFCLSGQNDIAAGLTGAQTWTLCQTWASGIKAIGFKLVIGTIFAQNRGTTWDTERLAFNTLLKASSGVCDAVADFASDSIIGSASNTSNTTYYQADQVHLTEYGVKTCLLPYFLTAVKLI
jgi:hypothetical protein